MLKQQARCLDSTSLEALLDTMDKVAEPDAATLIHLESCEACQRELESLAAEASFWTKAPEYLSAQQLALEPGLRRSVAKLQAGIDETPVPSWSDLQLGEILQPFELPGHLGRLGHYEIIEVIGRGGMGVVLKGLDTRLNRIVAIKLLTPEWARNADARQRFVREARAAAAVRDEQIVAIHAVEEFSGLPCLVMDYIPGTSLQARIEQGPIAINEVLAIGMQIAQGLAAAHAQGLVHRDVKPANILLEASGRVKLTDFGLARAVDDVSLTKTGVIAGTPEYMAPEQGRAERVDARADLFALGSVLYAMCAGRAPFQAATSLGVLNCICEAPAPSLRQINPEVPEELIELIGALHAKNAADRLLTASDVADLLRQHLAYREDPERQPRPGAVGMPRRPVRHRWLLAAGSLVVLLAAALGLTETTGITHLAHAVIRVFTPEGVFVVEVNDPKVKVTIENDGKDIVISGVGVHEVRVRPGKYGIRATRDGKEIPVANDVVVLRSGDKEVVRLRREIVKELSVEEKVQQAKRTLEEAKLIAELMRCDEALRAKPGDRLLLADRARVLAKLNRLDEAIAELSKVIAATKPGEGDFAGAHGTRGSLYQQRGDLEKALTDYQERVRLKPGEAWPYGRIAELYLFGPKNLRDAKKALEAAQLALKQPDANLNYHSTRAVSLYRLERYKEAVELLEQTYAKGKALNGHTPMNRYYAALSYHQLGEPAKARACYEQALKLPPDTRWSNEMKSEADAVLRPPVNK